MGGEGGEGKRSKEKKGEKRRREEAKGKKEREERRRKEQKGDIQCEGVSFQCYHGLYFICSLASGTRLNVLTFLSTVLAASPPAIYYNG